MSTAERTGASPLKFWEIKLSKEWATKILTVGQLLFSLSRTVLLFFKQFEDFQTHILMDFPYYQNPDSAPKSHYQQPMACIFIWGPRVDFISCIELFGMYLDSFLVKVSCFLKKNVNFKKKNKGGLKKNMRFPMKKHDFFVFFRSNCIPNDFCAWTKRFEALWRTTGTLVMFY